MEIEFGHIREYNLDSGFGFVVAHLRILTNDKKRGFGFTLEISSTITPNLLKN
ncbi:MAG TPA: hypothetical protein V6D21_05380 [Candidatus Obscuribacterales bacterium]